MYMLICIALCERRGHGFIICIYTLLMPPAKFLPPLPVCNWVVQTDTCPVLTFSVNGVRVPVGWTVTPDRAKRRSNAARIVNYRNLLAVLQPSHQDLLRTRVKTCVRASVRGNNVQWCDSFGVLRRQLSAKMCVCAWGLCKMSAGEGKVHWEFRVNVFLFHSPCSIHPEFAWQQVAKGPQVDVSESVTHIPSAGHGGETRRL